MSLVNTLAELLASDLCAGSLSLVSPCSFFYFFLQELCIGTYLFQSRKRDPDLLRAREVFPLEKYVIYTSNILVKVLPLTLLYLIELIRVNPK